MLELNNTALVIVDVQGKLAQLMSDSESLFANLQRMVKGAKVLDLPILWVEQNPEKLGSTIVEVSELLKDQTPFSKMSFSCAGSQDFLKALNATGRQQVLLVGIETHICVYQTAVDLVKLNFEVEVVGDAVSSRFAHNKVIGLEKMKAQGISQTSTEMALFELMKTADHDAFKEIQKAIK
jgi:nicotinamidase-related amidase